GAVRFRGAGRRAAGALAGSFSQALRRNDGSFRAKCDPSIESLASLQARGMVVRAVHFGREASVGLTICTILRESRLMKSKAAQSASTKTSINGNGHGNGKPTEGADARAKTAAAPAGGRLAELESLDKKQLLAALNAFKKGDFSVRLPEHLAGIDGKIADAFNAVVDLNERMADELDRVSHVVGKEGKISQRASIGSVAGSWAEAID